MELHERIIAYVEKHYPTSMNVLEGIVLSKGFTLNEFYAALEKVHKDKRIIQSNRRGDVWYEPYIEPEIVVQKHLVWLRTNYPPMDSTNDGSGIDIDLSWLFLRSREERDAYKAAASGRPVYMVKSKYDSNN